jgi:hypothetical protein
LSVLFPEPTYIFPLDPSFEPTADNSDDSNMEAFALLQQYNRINLVKPIDEEHMYYAAMNSTGCRLTVLGAHYWNLVQKKLL